MKKKNQNKMRFGDVIREELKNPDSCFSVAVRRLNAWKQLVKINPIRYKLCLENGYIVLLDSKKEHVHRANDGYLTKIIFDDWRKKGD